MNNQEKNSYVRSQILKALLEMMRVDNFDSITISRLTKQKSDVPPFIVIIKQKKTSCVRRQNVLITNLTISEEMMIPMITG